MVKSLLLFRFLTVWHPSRHEGCPRYMKVYLLYYPLYRISHIVVFKYYLVPLQEIFLTQFSFLNNYMVVYFLSTLFYWWYNGSTLWLMNFYSFKELIKYPNSVEVSFRVSWKNKETNYKIFVYNHINVYYIITIRKVFPSSINEKIYNFTNYNHYYFLFDYK